MLGRAVAVAANGAEGFGKQGVAGKYCSGFSEHRMVCRPASSQAVVIHGRQVVVNQGKGVNHFDCRGVIFGRLEVVTAAAGFIESKYQKRSDSFAAGKQRIFHGVKQCFLCQAVGVADNFAAGVFH